LFWAEDRRGIFLIWNLLIYYFITCFLGSSFYYSRSILEQQKEVEEEEEEEEKAAAKLAQSSELEQGLKGAVIKNRNQRRVLRPLCSYSLI